MSNLPADAALTLRKKRGFSVCSVAGSRSRDYQSDPHFQCGIALRAFSVWDASRSKTYGLPFRGKTAVMPLTLGRAALCPPPRRLPFHRQNASIPLPLFFPTTRAPHFFIWGALTSLWNIFDAKDCFPPKKCCVPANVKPYSLAFRGKTCSFRPRRAGRRCAAASPFAFFKGKLF